VAGAVFAGYCVQALVDEGQIRNAGKTLIREEFADSMEDLERKG
jgi:hypothetical protein